MTNILLKKVPDRLFLILKGVAIILVSGVISFLLFFIIILMGFGGDMKGPDNSTTAWLVCGLIFLSSLYWAFKAMFRKIN